MLTAILWYLGLSVLGWLAFPLAFRFLHKLPDRGYSVSKAFGLLLWAFLYWILGSYGFLENDAGGLIIALMILVGVSVWAWRGLRRGEIRSWLSANASLVISIEVLFLLAFAAMIFVRASNPDVLNTEKPMELAFINAILRSPSMPPHDPWLSGYSISYYYFGYVMVAMLAKVTGATGGVAFNLGVSMVFAMAALGAYGLTYNLLAIRRPNAARANRWAALLAPLFVLILGNLEGLLEILHARHLFWGVDAAGSPTSPFWSWLDIRELVLPPVGEAAWKPRLYGTGWWWWRASRVINDVNFLGIEQEVIDEFPAFSFVLGDLHPHVLSMPFVFLAVALVLNFYLGGADRSQPLKLFGLRIRKDYLIISALVFGGLAFLNIWDFPIYLLLFAGVYAYRRARQEGWGWARLVDFISLVVVMVLLGALAYLPFYLAFSSQAAGILPNLLNPTRGTHLWVMFATLLLPLIAYLLLLWRRDWQPNRLLKGLFLGFLFTAALWAFSLLLAWLYANLISGRELGGAILNSLGAADINSLFNEAIRRRLNNPGGWLSLAMLLALLLGILWPRIAGDKKAKKSRSEDSGNEHGRTFVLLLALFATLLVLAPEFIYLRDQFGTRMNTVFKFYFQAWLMWGVVAAYASSLLISETRGLGRWLSGLLIILVLGIGLIYPIFGFSDRMRRAENQPLQLDGTRYLSVDETAAVLWLQQAPLETLAEAVGGQYSDFARYATHSGQPGVMGWPGHENQWRGGSVDFWPRIGDIETLYSTSNWELADEILQKYDVGYLVIGSLERGAYAVSEMKFIDNLELVFSNAQVNIYLVP